MKHHVCPGMEQAPGGMWVINDLPTHQEIAIMVNTSRETVTRALSSLVAAGVVEKDMRRLLIRKPDALKRLAEEGPKLAQPQRGEGDPARRDAAGQGRSTAVREREAGR